MKFAVSVAMVVLLLAMPLSCIFVAQTHACCPRPDKQSKCPYDAIDSAKVANPGAVVSLPATVAIQIVPQVLAVALDPAPSVAEDGSDLHLLHRVLRI
jgi:hypothetical protein